MKFIDYDFVWFCFYSVSFFFDRVFLPFTNWIKNHKVNVNKKKCSSIENWISPSTKPASVNASHHSRPLPGSLSQARLIGRLLEGVTVGQCDSLEPFLSVFELRIQQMVFKRTVQLSSYQLSLFLFVLPLLHLPFPLSVSFLSSAFSLLCSLTCFLEAF